MVGNSRRGASVFGELLGLLHSLATVNGLVTDLPIGIRFEERPQITPDHLAVIGYQDANRHWRTILAARGLNLLLWMPCST